MKSVVRLLLAVAAGVALNATAAAQVKIQINQKKQIKIQPVQLLAGNAGLKFIQDAGVQKELKLNDEQKKKITKLAEDQEAAIKAVQGRQRFQVMRQLQQEAEAALKKILDKRQWQRYEQLQVQAKGTAAFFDRKISKELQIDADQRKEIAKLRRESFQQRRNIFQKHKGNVEAIRKAIYELERKLVEKVVKKLKPEQQKKWRELAGEPYSGVLPPVRNVGFIRAVIPGRIRPLPVQPKKIQRLPKKKIQPKNPN